MLELPFLDELVEERVEKRVAERLHKAIMTSLHARFEVVPADLEDQLRPIDDDVKLDQLVAWAATCPNIAAFRSRLSQES